MAFAVVSALASLPLVFADDTDPTGDATPRVVIRGTDGAPLSGDPSLEFYPINPPPEARALKLTMVEFPDWSGYQDDLRSPAVYDRAAICQSVGVLGSSCFVHGRTYTARMTVVGANRQELTTPITATRTFVATIRLVLESDAAIVGSREPFQIRLRPSSEDQNVPCFFNESPLDPNAQLISVPVPLQQDERQYSFPLQGSERTLFFAFECPSLVPTVPSATLTLSLQPIAPTLSIISPRPQTDVPVGHGASGQSSVLVSILADHLPIGTPLQLRWSLNNALEVLDSTISQTNLSKTLSIPISAGQLGKSTTITLRIVEQDPNGSLKQIVFRRVTVVPKGSSFAILAPADGATVPVERTLLDSSLVSLNIRADTLPANITKVLRWSLDDGPEHALASFSGASDVRTVAIPIPNSRIGESVRITVKLYLKQYRQDNTETLVLIHSQTVRVQPQTAILSIQSPQPDAIVPIDALSRVAVTISAQGFMANTTKLIQWSLNGSSPQTVKALTTSNVTTSFFVPISELMISQRLTLDVQILEKDKTGALQTVAQQRVGFTPRSGALTILTPSPSTTFYHTDQQREVKFLASMRAQGLPWGQKELAWSLNDSTTLNRILITRERTIQRAGIPITIGTEWLQDLADQPKAFTLKMVIISPTVVDEKKKSIVEERVPFIIQRKGATTTTFGAAAKSVVSVSQKSIVRPGAREEFRITLKNTGTAPWRTGEQITLSPHPLNNPTHTLWNAQSNVPISRTVNPGETVTLVMVARAPSTPNRYRLQWRMTRSVGVGGILMPFGDIVSTSILNVVQ